MKTSLLAKPLLMIPSLLGISLALPLRPGLAEVQPSDTAAPVAQTVQEPSAAVINPDAPVPIQASALSNSVLVSKDASDLRVIETPNTSAQTWQQGQGDLSQFSVQPIAVSEATAVTPAVDLEDAATGLSTTDPTISFPSNPAMEQLLLASQDLIGCRVANIACPSPNPAQFVTPAGSTTSPTEPAPTETSPTTPTATRSDRWHVLFTPIVYVPFAIYGNATVKGFDANVSLGPSSIFSAIRNSLQFVFFGRTEAWTPDYRLGFILGGDYIASGQNNTFTRQNSGRLTQVVINRVVSQIQGQLTDSQRQQIADLVQNSGLTNEQIRQRVEQIVGERLNQIVPTQIRSDVKVQVWAINLAAAYRFYNPSQVNPKGVATEFDLGPIVFDVIGGLRLGGTSGEVDVTSNLGDVGNFSNSVFNIVPLIGLRFRYNAAHNLALVLSGSTSGFGINTFWQWSAIGGIDWMFSGNTSLGAGWRFAGINYETGSGRDAFGVNLNNNGPYLNFTFRF